jgi:hypothetical protein
MADMRRKYALIGMLLCVIAIPGYAATISSFTATSGDLAANALFVSSGSNLAVTLTNTSLSYGLVPTDVLTGVFFDHANISNVSFQYGTGLDEPNKRVQEAGALVLFGTGLIGLVGYRRIRRMQ